jgi:RNA polymerase sigma-70 factor (ECF subfamily)
LLERLRNWEDEESWREFFDTYWKLIYGVAVKTGLTDAEAQEVVQETVIAVAKRMPEFRYDPALGSFKSWLLHTTRWKIADQFRKRLPARAQTRQSPTAGSCTALIERVPDPIPTVGDAVWDEQWRQAILDAALERVKRRVKAKQVQMFDLYVLKNWPVTDVARALGVSAARVYLAKHRVAALLKKEIETLEQQAFA